ncbi:AMP-dependent synthetase/ligase [bacterium]|nr:AMP-dependent synthetase/ligase [bacterium]
MADEKYMRPDRGIFPLSDLTKRSAKDFGNLPVMRIWDGKGYSEIDYNELHRRVTAVARWLIGQGIKAGDRVAVLGQNSPDWAISYLGIQTAGAVAVPVDSLMPSSGIRHIISDSGSRILFVGDKFLEMLDEMEPIKTLEKTIAFNLVSKPATMSLSDVVEAGETRDDDVPDRDLDDLAAILYTSGTTGYSKGVMLTQRNISTNVAAVYSLFGIGPEDTFLSVLPVHHSFEATAGFLLPIYSGSSITYARSLKSAEIVEDIKNTGVTFMVGVPLLFEKMMMGMQRKLKQAGKDKLVKTLMGVAKAGNAVGLNLSKPLFNGLRSKAGMDKIRIFCSGGGPLDPQVAVFFNTIGLNLFQGYGLTETSPVTHVNRPWKIKHHTVGPTIPGVECKIIDVNDQGVGEVCVKGPNVFKGYYKNDKATAETFTDDGWFRTGDLGLIDADGYLQITGRKKNMIVTGGGKNVYPEEIEHHINHSDFIAESLVLGVPREKGLGEEVAALIFPDYEQVDLYFEQKKQKPEADDVHSLIKAEIQKYQKDLADYKRIRFFRVLDEEFQKTSTKKIKRFLYDGEMAKVNGGKV